MTLKTIKDAQDEVDKVIEKFGGYWPPLSMLASIVEEIGEVSREINALEKYKPKKEIRLKQSIKEEIADTFFSLICIANYYNIDLKDELEKVIKKYMSRDSKRFH